MIDFSGKTALITGASGGIGSATAKMFASLGADLVISSTKQGVLDIMAEELNRDYGIMVRTVVCDLSDEASLETLFHDIDKLSILVCNAGIRADGLSMRMSNEDFRKVVDVNLFSTFVLNKLAVKKMMRERYGRIINISSVVGVSGNAGQSNYCASKAGMIGMTKSIAQEVASIGITVNCVAPGFTDTSMTETLTEEQKEVILSKIPMKRMANSLEIAQSIAFLASDAAAYITGHTLHVNGGMLMV